MNEVKHPYEVALMKGKNEPELIIVQQNVCGRNIYERTWSIQDYEELIKEVKGKNPDIIFLTEFYYQQMYDVTKIILEGYEFIKPSRFSKNDEEQKGLYATCLLAIKKAKVTKDKQFELMNMLDLRYICVDLNIKNEKIMKTLLLYVPQTYNAPPYRVKQKEKMLRSTSNYVSGKYNNLLFVGGDMNSDIDGKTITCIDVFEEIYNKMVDTDCIKEATWKGKRLDYALVSEKIKNKVNTIPIKIKSDHRGLKTVFSALK